METWFFSKNSFHVWNIFKVYYENSPKITSKSHYSFSMSFFTFYLTTPYNLFLSTYLKKPIAHRKVCERPKKSLSVTLLTPWITNTRLLTIHSNRVHRQYTSETMNFNTNTEPRLYYGCIGEKAPNNALLQGVFTVDKDGNRKVVGLHDYGVWDTNACGSNDEYIGELAEGFGKGVCLEE